ncbi:porin family protein [Ruegeria sp. WL0004]|uniref:Porin family protein n=1 Tax=Ruegeria marisflavi TaxID=2984152 RepID=A0ABT2WMC9_9RHOB|nr:porin family protein [Ruegeria sp. WL0004]MCU9837049.1 porin family protein [Ruegeria sp. WL0004]
MKLLVSAAAIISVASLPALAGEFNGPYLGLGVGYTDADGPGARDGDNTSFGGHVGYDYSFGSGFVLGGEVEYDRVNADLGGAGGTIDNIGRFKVKAGYDFGPVLGYGVVGAARATTSFGNDTGLVYGVGLAYPVTEQWAVSGEVLRHEFNDLGGAGSDFNVDTFNLRASFRF